MNPEADPVVHYALGVLICLVSVDGSIQSDIWSIVKAVNILRPIISEYMYVYLLISQIIQMLIRTFEELYRKSIPEL